MTATDPYDVAVIGGGIVGAAIARELAGRCTEGRPLRVALVEARADVGDGTSKANTAILHTGFDATPGTLESRLVARGYHLLMDYAAESGIPLETRGAILVAWDQEQLEALPDLKAKAEANGYQRCEIVDAESVYAEVPGLGAGALGGLTVPDEGIICTWTTNLALATDAALRGVRILLEHPVTSVDSDEHGNHVLHSPAGTVTTRWVVNAAGLGSDTIDRLFGHDRFTVTPRHGELFVFDKAAAPMVPKIVLPVPSKLGKGVLVSPTIYGNVMLGPTAEDMDDKSATGTSEAGFAFLVEKGQRLMPALLDEEITAAYAGLRAATEHSDYVVDVDGAQRYVVAGGIRSTGLTSGMAIAEHLSGLLADAGLDLTERTDLPATPRMPTIGQASVRPYQDETAIAGDPAYGEIVCFCERVTRGEIRDAMTSTLPPRTLDGLRRRTRAMNGRCQAFFCGAAVQTLFESGRSSSPRSTDDPTPVGA